MKFFSLISSAAALTMLSAIGFCEVQMQDLESRVSEMEKTSSLISYSNDDQSSQMRRPTNERRSQDMGSAISAAPITKAILTTARGCPNENGPYFDVEFLCLRAVEDGLDYASKGSQSVTPTNFDINAKAKGQDFEFDPGFRVGLGYNFDYDNWDLHAYYTWHYTYPKTSESVGSLGENFVLGLFALTPVTQSVLTYQIFNEGKSNWQLQFNSWDLEMGRNFYVSKNLALHPVAGIKGALIRQHLMARYNSESLIGGGQVLLNASHHAKTRYWGIGPKLGVFGEWELGKGFSINADVHGALLYGQFNTRAAQAGQFVNGLLYSLRVDDDFYRLRPMAYCNIGLEWGRCFWDWMFFSIHIGWEAQYWWQQMEFLSYKDITPDGDLSLTGMNVGFRFDF